MRSERVRGPAVRVWWSPGGGSLCACTSPHRRYKFHHSNRVMSLFSASRYMGTYSNKGAFLVLEHGSRKNLQQFIAHRCVRAAVHRCSPTLLATSSRCKRGAAPPPPLRPTAWVQWT